MVKDLHYTIEEKKENGSQKNCRNKLCFASFLNQWMNVDEDSSLSLVKIHKQAELKVKLVCKALKKVHCAVEVHK